MNFQLIDDFKSAWKLSSVRVAILFAVFQWHDNLLELGFPSTAEEWSSHLVSLIFIITRIVYQPTLHPAPADKVDEHEDNSIG